MNPLKLNAQNPLLTNIFVPLPASHLLVGI